MIDADTRTIMKALQQVKDGDKIPVSLAKSFAAAIRECLQLSHGQIQLIEDEDSRDRYMHTGKEP